MGYNYRSHNVLQHAVAPNHNPEIGGLAVMADEQSTKRYGRGFTPEEIQRAVAARRAKGVSEETRPKLSLALRGRKRTPEHQAKLNASQTGRPKPPEVRAKISATLTGQPGRPHGQSARDAISKAQRARWVDVRSQLSRVTYEYRAWRRAVVERDERTCQRCGAAGLGRNIHAHHIKPFKDHPELRFDVANGITLCAACHVIEERLGHVQPV